MLRSFEAGGAGRTVIVKVVTRDGRELAREVVPHLATEFELQGI
jgi:hypothetical protein